LTIRPGGPFQRQLFDAAPIRAGVISGSRIDGWRVLDDGTWSVAIPEAA
jgi:hypothetical protein